MRCQACDCLLTDFEATRKSAKTHEYFDLCNDCFESSGVDQEEVIQRFDLMEEIDYDESV